MAVAEEATVDEDIWFDQKDIHEAYEAVCDDDKLIIDFWSSTS